jgi:hypothetical protein
VVDEALGRLYGLSVRPAHRASLAVKHLAPPGAHLPEDLASSLVISQTPGETDLFHICTILKTPELLGMCIIVPQSAVTIGANVEKVAVFMTQSRDRTIRVEDKSSWSTRIGGIGECPDPEFDLHARRRESPHDSGVFLRV